MPFFQLVTSANALAVVDDHDDLKLTSEDNLLQSIGVCNIGDTMQETVEVNTHG